MVDEPNPNAIFHQLLGQLVRFSGAKPPRVGFTVSVSQPGLLLIGHIVTQWGA